MCHKQRLWVLISSDGAFKNIVVRLCVIKFRYGCSFKRKNKHMNSRKCLFSALLGLLIGACSFNDDNSAELVVLNGNILTVDDEYSKAEAVAIRDGVFIAIGGNDEIKEYAGEETIVIDAAGKTVVPGLIESHTHATSVVSRELAAGRPFEQLTSIGEIQDWLRTQVDQTTGGEWIRLPRVDVTRIQEGRIPTSEELDEAAPDHPAVFVWQYADRQIQVLNSAAMEVAGITRDTQAPEGGRIHFNPDGEPTGRLEDSAELTSGFLKQRDFTESEFLDGLEQLLRQYNEVGITSIFERSSDEDGFYSYQKLKDEGRLPVRSTVTMRLRGLDGTRENAEEAINEFPVHYADGDDWVRVGPLKFRMDGGVLYGTAYMREPYGESAFELYGIDDPAYRGSVSHSTDEVENIIFAGHSLGWQMSAHVTGDAGVDIVLDAIEAVNSRLDGADRDHRFTLIHAYFANPETAQRIERMGVGVDTQPAWFYMDGDALLNALGEDRLSQFIGLNTWQQADVKVTINSDHMQGYDPNTSLNPYNPFLTMYTAITRSTINNEVIAPEQRVSREDALRMMTRNAAWFSFDEEKKGSIEVGKFGDLAILTDDLLNCEEENIKDIRSLLTVVGGKIVYESEFF